MLFIMSQKKNILNKMIVRIIFQLYLDCLIHYSSLFHTFQYIVIAEK